MANTRSTKVVLPASQAYDDAARRRQIADALTMQATAPRQVTPGPTLGYVANGLTQLGQALLARQAQQKAKDAQGAADNQMRDTNRAAIEKLAGAYQIEGMPGESPTPLAGGNLPGSKIDAALAGTDPRQANQMLAQALLQKSMPQAPEPYTLGQGERRYAGGRVIADNPKPPTEPATPADIQEYNLAVKQGFPGSILDYQTQKAKAGAAQSNVNVNTEKNLYGNLASEQAKQYSALYDQAQKAPDLVARAQRVKAALGPESDAITGAGANWLLAGAKAAAQLGFNTGDAATDTEMLSRELAASTLDSIKSSGLGGGSGFSNADRDFLEKAVGGSIKLEAGTLRKLADLNERAGKAVVTRWNSTARRLDPQQLKTMGMSEVWMPGDGMKKIASDSDYESLPSGSTFIAPDGSQRRKP